MRYFDFEKVAHEARIPSDKLAAISRSVRQDFPHDDMMHELHLLRACLAVRDGHATLEEVLASDTRTRLMARREAERVRQQTARYIDRHGWDVTEDEETWRAYQQRRMDQDYRDDEW